MIRGQATGGCRPGCDHHPDNPSCTQGITLDLDTRAADLAARIRRALTRAGHTWATTMPGPITRPQHTRIVWVLRGPARIALELADEDLDTAVWAGPLAAVLLPAIGDAERACGGRAPARPVGRCTECTAPLTAREDDTTVTCPSCGHSTSVEQATDDALAIAEHVTGTATELARILGTTPAVIRGHAHRGNITAASTSADGQPRYRLGDVRRAINRTTYGAPARPERRLQREQAQ